MAKKLSDNQLQNLPKCAAEFIKLVIKKMRYRKSVRREVTAELAGHFEDELKECANDEEKQQKAEKLIAEFGDAKLLGILLRRAKKRCRPLWRTVIARTFQAVGLIIVSFIVYCVYITFGSPNISTNYVEQMNLLTRPVADESLNAAGLYQKAIDKYQEPPEILYESEKKPFWKTIKGKDWIDDLSQEEFSALEQWISSNAEAIAFFTEGSEKPYCWWERKAKNDMVLYVLMPELSSMRNLVKMMAWRAKLKAHNGDVEQAFDDLLVCYRVGTHLKGPRSLIDQLVGIAVEALSVKNTFVIVAHKQVDSQLLKSFQDELAELMAEDSYVISYQVEKFFALDFLQRCYTDNGRGSGHLIPGKITEFMQEVGWYDSINEETSEGNVLEYIRSLAMAIAGANRSKISLEFEYMYNKAQQWAYKTPWQVQQEKTDFDRELADWSNFKRIRYWPVSVFMPALRRVSELGHRIKTDTEALITVL